MTSMLSKLFGVEVGPDGLEFRPLTIRRALVALAFVACLMNGCQTRIPSGYDADTTPDHDGEEWVGGQ